MTFGEAFAKARKEQGSGGTFTYKGKKYSTNRADDKAKVTKNNVEKKTETKPVKKTKTDNFPVKKPTKKKETTEKKSLGKIISDGYKDTKDAILRPNARQFMYDIFGGSGDITEDDYGPEYLDSMRQLAKNAIADNRSYIDYKDYDIDSYEKDNIPLVPDFIENMYFSGDEAGRQYDLKTLIGGGGLNVEDGNLYLTDDYDFNTKHKLSGGRYTPGADIPEAKFSNLPDILSTILGRGINMDGIRTAASYLSSGEEDQNKSKAKINLGPASDFYDEDKLAGIMSTDAAKDMI